MYMSVIKNYDFYILRSGDMIFLYNTTPDDVIMTSLRFHVFPNFHSFRTNEISKNILLKV